MQKFSLVVTSKDALRRPKAADVSLNWVATAMRSTFADDVC